MTTPEAHARARPPDAGAILDPSAAARAKAERARWLHTRRAPLVRLGGTAILCGLVLLHNRLLLDQGPDAGFLAFVALAGAWGLGSWLALHRWYDPERRPSLPFLALVGDVGVWTLALHVSGGPESLLFPILLMHAADQSMTTVRRVVLLGTLSVLAYAALLVWWTLAEGVDVPWTREAFKLLLLWGISMYLTTVSATAEAMRERTRAAIRLARSLLGQLTEQATHLENARLQAEAASRAKSQFLATMSHELRTPLHGVLGALDVLEPEEPGPARSEMLEVARSCAEHLLSLIDRNLDFARLEREGIALCPEPLDPARLAREVARELGPMAQAKGLELAVEVAPDTPSCLLADPLRLRQILVNLLANAVKFTSRGRVALTVGPAPTSRHREGVLFRVRDTGCGVPEGSREAIFEPFRQADGTSTRTHDGCGLGLAISRELARRMGGELVLEDTGSGGSSFALVLPVGEESAPPPDRHRDETVPGAA